MVAIKKSGIIVFEITDGAFNGDTFISFIREKLVGHFESNPNDVLGLDNCSVHHKREVIDLLNSKTINYHFVPPYSPQLTPIEDYFSHLKSVLGAFNTFPKTSDEHKLRACNIYSSETINFERGFINMKRYVKMALSRQDFIYLKFYFNSMYYVI